MVLGGEEEGVGFVLGVKIWVKGKVKKENVCFHTETLNKKVMNSRSEARETHRKNTTVTSEESFKFVNVTLKHDYNMKEQRQVQSGKVGVVKFKY